MLLETSFWISVGIPLYVYLGYPLLCCIWAQWFPRRTSPESPPEELPSVSIITAAFNEQDCIGPCIANKLALDYPHDLVEHIVVSDASTDGTDNIIQSYVCPRVRFLRQENRLGKTAALNLAAGIAKGRILAFSDANSMWEGDALKNLVAPFADNGIGYVTGQLVYRPAGTVASDGCSSYMTFENRLRTAETQIDSVVGVDGGIDAIRAELYRPMRVDQLPDLILPFSARAAGFRIVYEQRAKSHEDALTGAADEFAMRVRVALRAMRAIRESVSLLNPVRFGVFAWQLMSHKVLRYLAPWPMVWALVVAAILARSGSGFWQAVVALQLAFYTWAIIGLRGAGRAQSRVLAWPSYFVLVNAAALIASLMLLSGARQSTWRPRH